MWRSWKRSLEKLAGAEGFGKWALAGRKWSVWTRQTISAGLRAQAWASMSGANILRDEWGRFIPRRIRRSMAFTLAKKKRTGKPGGIQARAERRAA